jgi:hypothetical protein
MTMDRRVLRIALGLWAALVAAAPLAAQKSILVDYEQAFTAFWDVPSEDRPNVTKRGDMAQNPTCANNALGQARGTLKGAWAIAAYRALGVEILKGYIKGATAFGGWGQADEVEKAIDFLKKFDDYAEMALESDTPEDFAEKVTEKIGNETAEKISKKYGKDAFKKIWEYFLPTKPTGTFEDDSTSGSCKVHLTLQVIKPAAGQKGHLYFSALGTDCHCITLLAPEGQPRSWRVIGNADLKLLGKKGDKLLFGITNVTYEVSGACGCATTTTGPPSPTPYEPPPPPPGPTPTATPRFPGDNDDLVNRDKKVAEQKCKQHENDYQNSKSDADEQMRRCFGGDKSACEKGKQLLKKRDEARKKFCDCAKEQYGKAKLPLPPEVERICNPPTDTPTPTRTPTPTPVTPSKPPADPCDTARQAYERARQAYIDGGFNNPTAERNAATAKRNYCECLRKHFKGKLPPEVAKFCGEPAGVFPAPPTFTPPPEGCANPGSYMIVQKECRNGVWYNVRYEEWRCPDGTVQSRTELSATRTNEPCTPTGTSPTPTRTPVPVPPPTQPPSTPPPSPTFTPRSTAPSPSPTNTPKPSGSACNPTGTWMAAFTVASDPNGHAAYVQLMTAMLMVQASGGDLMITSAAPQLRSSTGSLNLTQCSFAASGSGDSAGRTAVAFRITNGKLQGRNLTFDLEIGTDGKLPGGSIKYRATATMQ